jgi:cyclopropane-fatty-acyl-phospholipid synthase
MMTRNSPSKTSPTVVHCYSVLERFFRNCGLFDYTEGMYHGDPAVPYEQAQRNQLNYLLDEIGCQRGVRVLDVGCGAGTLLELVRERGGVGTGITISPDQQRWCQSRGLDVRLVNYVDLLPEFEGTFDAVVANGSLEHFVQPSDAAAGRSRAIYRRMFSTFYGVLDPHSPVRRVATTAIHFVRCPIPRDLLRSPLVFPRGSDAFHYAMLARSMGGWYPTLGQLEQCAEGYFEAAESMDGTYDYYLTSEEWLRRVRAGLRSRRLLRIVAENLRMALRHPLQFLTLIDCALVAESWNWQFRGPQPPTRLLRHTWQAKPVMKPDSTRLLGRRPRVRSGWTSQSLAR